MADFYLYKPIPTQQSSLRSAPAVKAFDMEPNKVEFYNGNDDPVLVHFQAPLQASRNPLKIQPLESATVKIEPLAAGDFPCLVEILASRCPTCKSRLTKKHGLSLSPDASVRLEGETESGMQLPGPFYYRDGDDECDEGPTIKINP